MYRSKEKCEISGFKDTFALLLSVAVKECMHQNRVYGPMKRKKGMYMRGIREKKKHFPVPQLSRTMLHFSVDTCRTLRYR